MVSTQALILGLVGLAMVTTWAFRGGRLLGIAFLVLAVLCQHRSVWASLVVAIVAMVLLVPRVRRRIISIAVITGTLLSAYAFGLLDPLLAKFGVASHDRATLTDRKFAWRVLVDEQNAMGGQAVLFGQPFGSGFDRIEPDGTVATYAPHNWYVLLYLRIGLVGAVAVAVALVRGLWRNFRLARPVGVAWAAGLITYCLAYNLEWYAAPVLAVALAGTRAQEDVETPPSERGEVSLRKRNSTPAIWA